MQTWISRWPETNKGALIGTDSISTRRYLKLIRFILLISALHMFIQSVKGESPWTAEGGGYYDRKPVRSTEEARPPQCFYQSSHLCLCQCMILKSFFHAGEKCMTLSVSLTKVMCALFSVNCCYLQERKNPAGVLTCMCLCEHLSFLVFYIL